MQKHLVLVSLLATSSAFAANFGAPATGAAAPVAPVAGAAALAPVPPAAIGPQAATLFRIVKPDGMTVIQQGNMNVAGVPMDAINVSEKDAFISMNGRCAFNVKFDEISATAAAGTVTRLYSNDKLIAQPYNIALVPGVMKSIWTQPYLYPGQNNVRVVVNADGAAPSTKWVRINVAGTCGATPPVTTAPPPVVTPPVVPPTVTNTPPAPKTPPVVVTFKPGSAEWNNLNVVWGYSNYATTQLKSKGYARYDELYRLNAAVTAVINAKSVDQATYNSLMTTWNTFVTEAAFKAAMATVSASTSGQK